MKTASILVVLFIIPFTGCETDGDAYRSAAGPTPSTEVVISDATPPKEPAEDGQAKETVTYSPIERTLDLQTGIYGLPFGATTDEVMKWCADNNMAVANPTETDVKEAARNAVGRIMDLKDAYDFEVAFVTPLEQELLKLAQGYDDIGNEIERAKVAAAQEKLDMLKNPTVFYEGQKYYLGQVHKGVTVYLDNERKVCSKDRICKTAYLLGLTPTEKSEKMKDNGLKLLHVFLFGNIGEEPRTYATLAFFGDTPERSASTQFEFVLTGLTKKYGVPASAPWEPDSMKHLLGAKLASEVYRGSAMAWAKNLLLLGERGEAMEAFGLLHYDAKAATHIFDLQHQVIDDFEKEYHNKKKQAIAQMQEDF